MTGTGWRTRLGRDNQAPIKSRRLVPLRPGGRQVARKPHLGGHRPYEPAPRTPISMTPTRPYFMDVGATRDRSLFDHRGRTRPVDSEVRPGADLATPKLPAFDPDARGSLPLSSRSNGVRKRGTTRRGPSQAVRRAAASS